MVPRAARTGRGPEARNCGKVEWTRGAPWLTADVEVEVAVSAAGVVAGLLCGVGDRAGGQQFDDGFYFHRQVPVRSGAGDPGPHHVPDGRRHRAGFQRCPEIECPCRGEDLDGDDATQPVDGAAQLASGMPAHRHVVLLHRRRRDGIHRRRHGQPLQFRDDPGLGVLGDHVPGVDADLVGEKRRQALGAGRVEHPVGASLGDTRDVGDRDGQEVQHRGDRGAVEVAVGFHPAIRQHDRIVDGAGQFSAGDQAGVGGGVPGRAVHRRRAPQRVGVLHPGVLVAGVRGDDRRSGQRGGDPRGADGLTGLRAQRLQVGGEHPVGAHQRLHRHRRREIRCIQEHLEVGERHHQHAQHAVGAVDQRQALLLGQHDRGQPLLGERLGGRAAASARVDHLALADQRQRDCRQRREIAGAAERSVLRDDRGDAGAEHRGQGRRGLRADTGPATGQRRQPQQHQGADHLALDRLAAAGRVRPDQRGLQRGPAVRRDGRGGQCAEPGGDAVVRLDVIGQPLHDRPGSRPSPRSPSGRSRPPGRAGRCRRPARNPAAVVPSLTGGRSACGDCGTGGWVLVVNGHAFIGCRPARGARGRAGVVSGIPDRCRWSMPGSRAMQLLHPTPTRNLFRRRSGRRPRSRSRGQLRAGAAPALRRGLAVLRLLASTGHPGLGRRHRPGVGPAPFDHLRAAHRTGRRRIRRRTCRPNGAGVSAWSPSRSARPTCAVSRWSAPGARCWPGCASGRRDGAPGGAARRADVVPRQGQGGPRRTDPGHRGRGATAGGPDRDRAVDPGPPAGRPGAGAVPGSAGLRGPDRARPRLAARAAPGSGRRPPSRVGHRGRPGVVRHRVGRRPGVRPQRGPDRRRRRDDRAPVHRRPTRAVAIGTSPSWPGRCGAAHSDVTAAIGGREPA